MKSIVIVSVLFLFTACNCCHQSSHDGASIDAMPENATLPGTVETPSMICNIGTYDGYETILCRANCSRILAASYGDGTWSITTQDATKVEHQFIRNDDDIIWHAIRCSQ